MALLVVAGCGGASPAETADAEQRAAVDYAESALRAIEGTRFEPLGVGWIADEVVAACADLLAGGAASEVFATIIADAEVPEADAIDDAIAAVVLSEGVAAVCPSVSPTDGRRTDPVTDYLTATVPIVVAAGFGERFDGGTLVGAANEVCTALDAGTPPGDVVEALLESLFGGASAPGSLGEAEGLVAGAVLGGAAAIVCPRHETLVATYIATLQPSG